MSARCSGTNKNAIAIVLDACTLVDGIVFSGKEQEILNMVDNKKIILCVSQELVTEYNVAPWKMIKKTFQDNDTDERKKRAEHYAYLISKKVAKILCNGNMRKIINVTSNGSYIKSDPADDKLINLAIDGDIKYIISDNDHLFEDIGEVKTCNGNKICVLSPYAFVQGVKNGFIK